LPEWLTGYDETMQSFSTLGDTHTIFSI